MKNKFKNFFVPFIVLLIAFATMFFPTSSKAEKMTRTYETKIYEAEDGELSDLIISDELEGYSGTGYVEGFTNTTGEVMFKIEAESLGLYHLSIGYSTPDGGKETRLLLNGQEQGNITLPEIEGFSEVSAGNVLLNEGINSISLGNGWGWYILDYIKLIPAHAPEPHQVTAELINPNATDETKSLMAFMVDHFGTHILSGQQENIRSYLKDTNYIFDVTEKRPAIVGFDLMDQSPSRAERGASSDVIEHAIRWDNEMGGIVKFTWHWNAPKDLIDEAGKEWWRGFYTDATTFDIEYAINNPASEDYKLLIRDIDVISAELLKLQEQGIPVIWRPLHEAEGGWFWWGAKGPEPVIELWKIMYHRMTDYHGLNNLIWMWNSVDQDWYPGDNYVDMVSYDSYPGDFNYGPIAHRYEELLALSNNRKLISMAENGAIPDPDLLQAYHAYWNMFVTWNDFHQSANSNEHLNHVYHHDFVITLDDLPDFKTYIDEGTTGGSNSTVDGANLEGSEKKRKGKFESDHEINYVVMFISFILFPLGAVAFVLIKKRSSKNV